MTASFAVAVVAIVLVITLATLGHYLFWTRRLATPLPYELDEILQTPDGAKIQLFRVPGARTHATPVLLVHGIGMNHRNNDVLAERSLARHLAKKGHDVWLLRTRSGGLNRGPRARRLVRFPAMCKHDLPMAVAHVLERTGTPHLDYVGFSMGGMLLYGALARTLEPKLLRKVVIIGSPARVGGTLLFSRFYSRIPRAVTPPLPFAWPSRMIAFLADAFETPLHWFFLNPRNVDRGSIGRAMMYVEDIPGSLNADFTDFMRKKGVVHVDDRDVLETLTDVSVPALFFAGGKDRLAPVPAVAAAFDAWGKNIEVPSKRMVVLDKKSGASADYGHLDLAIGKQAEREIYEVVEHFLASESVVGEPHADARESA